jgi:hypothetical protein
MYLAKCEGDVLVGGLYSKGYMYAWFNLNSVLFCVYICVLFYETV